jgi:hypothetical protein
MIQKHKTFIPFIFFLSLLFFKNPALAWWTEDHPLITLLSFDRFREMGVTNKDYLRDMSELPDRKPSKLQKLFGHGATGRRSRQAFRAAVNMCYKGDYEKASGFLAITFHYLQDRGDPTKKLDDAFHVTRGRVARDIVRSMLNNREVKKNLYYRGYLIYKERSLTNHTFNDILNELEKLSKTQGRVIIGIFEDYRSYRNFNLTEKLRNELLKTLATIVACQNRIIELGVALLERP